MFAVIGFTLVQASACSDDSTSTSTGTTVCTAGQSVACVGPGGCSGGQSCNAQGTGYGECLCGANDGGGGASDAGGDASSSDSGANDASSVYVASVGLHLTFNITQSNDSPTTCAEEPSIASISTILSRSGGGNPLVDVFDCGDTGDVISLDFGTYQLVVDALNENDQSLGSSSAQSIVLDGKSCDSINGVECVKNLTVTIKLD